VIYVVVVSSLDQCGGCGLVQVLVVEGRVRISRAAAVSGEFLCAGPGSRISTLV